MAKIETVLEQLLWRIDRLEKRIATLETIEYGSGWIDYSSTSTIVGWSSYTIKKIYYKTIGRIVLIQFYLDGTSNATASNFTIPYISGAGFAVGLIIRVIDNGGQATAGLMELSNNSSTCHLFAAPNAPPWTASGNKLAYGQFWYEMA